MMKKGTAYRLTGLSGAGKTTIGTMLFDYMKKKQDNVVLLDGDALRAISENTDYSLEGRARQGRIARNLVKFLTDQGIDVIWCVIGMLEEERRLNRDLIDNYKEIYIKVSIEELIRRDSKGLYKAALEGKKENVYGINMKTEYPENPELVIENEGDLKPEDAVEIIKEKFAL